MVNREVRKEAIPTTSFKSRIAKNLGLSKPPTGTTIPLQKAPGERTVDLMKSNVGISSLSVLGDRNELIGFTE